MLIYAHTDVFFLLEIVIYQISHDGAAWTLNKKYEKRNCLEHQQFSVKPPKQSDNSRLRKTPSRNSAVSFLCCVKKVANLLAYETI